MFYDFHLHSALSPCANEDMTPNNIINMSLLKGLEWIAVCDHNTIKQQKTMDLVAKRLNIGYVFGVEVQTQEEVHVLCLFEKLEHCEAFGQWLEKRLPKMKNVVSFFGHQSLFNEWDELVDEEPILLLQSIEASIEEVCHQVHQNHGLFILAHVMDKANSIMTQLGFIPPSLAIDGIEIKKASEKDWISAKHPYLSEDLLWLNNSDAHQLIDIHEREFEIDLIELQKKWRKYL